MSERPVLHVVSAVIRLEDEIVLVLQGAPGEEPFWALPGGVLEEGELVPEALAREVLEETGLEIERPRLAFLAQIDNRRPEQLHRGRGPGSGFLVTVWTFEVATWSGELGTQDPDRFVSEARFVSVPEAVERLRRTPWLTLAADYLEGGIERGSLHCRRWHEDGSAEFLPASTRAPSGSGSR
jgi:ADP-ribose pyrophosphatase YjhB (NUDIX family)